MKEKIMLEQNANISLSDNIVNLLITFVVFSTLIYFIG